MEDDAKNNKPIDTTQLEAEVEADLDARRKFYSDLAGKSRKTQLDRIKEQILDLPKSERDKLDEWNIDRRLDEKEQAESEAKLVSAMDFAADAAERINNWDKVNGLSSGYWVLDNMMMGLAPGELIIVAGQTSQGKTLLATNVAARLIMKDHKVMFVTLEMTHGEITSRFWKVLEAIGGEDALEKLENLMYQDNDKLTWKAIPLLIKKSVDAGCELIVIDHLHYFSREMENTAEGLGMVTQEFKRAALKYKVPVILISHTRKVEKGKPADISDLRGSSYIAQDADIVLMVSQKQEHPGKVFVELEKNRNRLKYRIGTEIGFDKQGLLLENHPHTSQYLTAFSQHDIAYEDTRSITGPDPAPEPISTDVTPAPTKARPAKRPTNTHHLLTFD